VLDWIRRGEQESAIYLNVRDLFDLLIQGLEHGIDSIDTRDVSGVLSNVEFAQCLWKTVTSRQIQYRMQIRFIRARQALIQNGIPEEAVPLTHELQLRLKEEESRASQGRPGSPQGARPLIPGEAPAATPKMD
jgi:hypothetical protein